MVKYRYKIHCHSSWGGEIYDKYSPWYNLLDNCEYNCLKKINSKKFKQELIDNECSIHCKIEVFITTDEKNIRCLSHQQNFSEYKVIKHIKNLTSSDLLEYVFRSNLFEVSKYDFEENIK